ncbi:MAG: helix-hairpin-helix domain-containing protein [Bacteroidales bacterium]|nr:helix-hairpin-helix domain-containing protein [Bacteroidales bacterium]MCM1414644.1 helix-hairpin-helix domain-containing protein [bacterium]MCM1424669.1 helix-hairpin-helix domain-containing protein [bacterium]
MQKKNQIRYTKKLVLTGALFAAALLCGCTRKDDLVFLTEETGKAESADADGSVPDLAEETEAGIESASAVEAEAESAPLCVHVCGAVEMPGVYELPAGSRVYEAVQAAGGFSADADQNYVNQAQILTDGVKLVIPTGEEAAAAAGGTPDAQVKAQEMGGEAPQIGIVGGGEASAGESAGGTGTKIDINTASEKELCNIPGIGQTRAAAIIAYRESHGSFTKPEDIMKVSGIKEGMYEKIKDSISVGN